jgi:transcriptional regulator with XRE-family HTH domain
MNHMDVPAELDALLRREGMTQAELAEKARVSQPTVSRAKRRVPRRNSESYSRLCSYIREVSREISLPRTVCDALAEIWDGSPEHAEALAGLIRAAGGLGRTKDDP